MKKLSCILFICWSISLIGQVDNFPKGKIIDSVSVGEGSRDTFSLYLPSQFSLNEQSSIVFIFEPAARGKVGITPFIKAAETYNYILVCSNDSKNGPYQRNFDISNRLFNKIFAEFNIDKKRIYTAGFSGGSRLATTIAILTKKIQGVIACGAGMSKISSHLPFNETFSYVGIVGDEDMNFSEMNENKIFLKKLNIKNQLFIYEMNHKWPSQEQILNAFDWLQLEAYKKRLITIDSVLIKNIYNNFYKDAIKFQNENKLYHATEIYRMMKTNFKEYFLVDSLNISLKNLEHKSAYKKELTELKNSLIDEKKYTRTFVTKFYDDLKKKKPKIKWWSIAINKLERKDSNSFKQKMINRLLFKIYAMAFESVNVQMITENIDHAIFCYDICLTIYPKNSNLYFKQAENYILKEKPEQALDYLEKLINSGYSNIKAIKENKTFESLKTNARFVKLTKA